ncbi:Zinc finger protein 862 [Mizuhopecten yessoensis]|uniref:Zinc finger protein 862 n=1 Tax=Mizuhopecten yessoensis TaxID=6573 RepID=A0A210R008_MIZYE|nr:Zinc finger protein 862 [Mizuhopecten yessoensis]
MSLLGWVTGAKPKTQPVKKTSEEIRETQKVYETKRQRKFQTAWQETFSWLVYDDEKNTVFCKVCRELETAGTFCTGNSNFKIDTIRIHDTADAHKFNVAKFNAKFMPVAQAIAAKSLVLLDKSRVGKLCTLFRTAHGMAKSGRPYTDFVWLCSLNEANGLDIGKTYRNDKAA